MGNLKIPERSLHFNNVQVQRQRKTHTKAKQNPSLHLTWPLVSLLRKSLLDNSCMPFCESSKQKSNIYFTTHFLTNDGAFYKICTLLLPISYYINLYKKK